MLFLYRTYEIPAEKVSCAHKLFSIADTGKREHCRRNWLFRLVCANFLEQKSARVSPVPFGRGHGKAENFRRFLERHADEITQLGQLRFFGVLGGQFVQRVMNSQQLVVIGHESDFHILQIHARLPAAARAYLERIEALVQVPIDLISTGAERDETIVLRHPFGS